MNDEFVAAIEEDSSFTPTEVDSFEIDIEDLRSEEGIEYPAVLLSGILFTDCLKVLQSQKRKSYREVSTWVELPDNAGFKNIGTIQLDSNTLLVLRHLNIRVTLYYDSENLETLNLEDPAVLEKFV